MSAPDRQRDGGVFTAGVICPWCGVGDVHHLRAPNPEPPQPPTALALQIRRMKAGLLADEQPAPRYRWDERPFEVVRTCTSCGYEWGQR